MPLDKSTIAFVAFPNDFVENQPHLGDHFETLETPPYRWRVGNSPGLVEPGTIHGASRSTAAYTTTLKLLQIMHAKGLVRRDETGHAHIYEATPEKTKPSSSLPRTWLSGPSPAQPQGWLSTRCHPLGLRQRNSPKSTLSWTVWRDRHDRSRPHCNREREGSSVAETLFHFLWQGAVIYLGIWFLRRLNRNEIQGVITSGETIHFLAHSQASISRRSTLEIETVRVSEKCESLW